LKQLAKKIEELARRDQTDETESRADKRATDQAVSEGKQALDSPGLAQSLNRALSDGSVSATTARASGEAGIAPAQASLAYSAGLPPAGLSVPSLTSPQTLIL
jgi:hypothetical protein